MKCVGFVKHGQRANWHTSELNGTFNGEQNDMLAVSTKVISTYRALAICVLSKKNYVFDEVWHISSATKVGAE